MNVKKAVLFAGSAAVAQNAHAVDIDFPEMPIAMPDVSANAREVNGFSPKVRPEQFAI